MNFQNKWFQGTYLASLKLIKFVFLEIDNKKMEHITTKFEHIQTVDWEKFKLTISKATEDEVYQIVSRILNPPYKSSSLRDIRYVSKNYYTKYLKYLMDQGAVIVWDIHSD